jgi:Spy/CpxP family protein refolding chaperone
VILRRLGLIALAVVASLAWTGCQPAVPPAAEEQKGRPLAQEKASPKAVPLMKVDENSIRVKLLMAEAVQKDLGLTADQMGKIRDFVEAGRERSGEFVAKWPAFSVSPGTISEMSEARARQFEASLKDWQSKQKELRAKVVGVLTPSQSERLKQIQLQHAIAAALAQPELIKALDISAAQLAKIRPLVDRIVEKLLAGLHDLDRLPPKERRKRSIELSKERDKAQAEANQLALDVLTPKQRAKLDKLVGRKIEVTWDYDALVPDDVVFVF